MKYKSGIFAAIHETMQGLHDIGAIDKKTMRGFDKSCLTEIKPLSGGDIKAIRRRRHYRKPLSPSISTWGKITFRLGSGALKSPAAQR